MSADARGYYAALELHPGASVFEVRAAFRRLAKTCHPDSGFSDGGERFRLITEACEALSDPAFKASYDAARSEPPQEDVGQSTHINPVICEVCNKVTAQPRRLAFWRVTGFILASSKSPVQKIFCRNCAYREQWKSTLWTSLFGWWGIPWGPIWSIGYGITNASGGTRECKVDENLLWRNAVAFAARGQGEIAVGLSNILRKSDDPELAYRSAEIIRFFSDRGIDPKTEIKDAWSGSGVRKAAMFTLAFCVPAAASALLLVPTSSSNVAQSANPYLASAAENPFADLIPADPSLDSTSGITPVVPVPESLACRSKPSNGEVLVDHRTSSEKGHILEIDNGSRGDAIVKVRDAVTEKMLASFFVGRGESSSLTNIPDGTYKVQYAIGETLAADCRTFTRRQRDCW